MPAHCLPLDIVAIAADDNQIICHDAKPIVIIRPPGEEMIVMPLELTKVIVSHTGGATTGKAHIGCRPNISFIRF
jgi:hypothetical protein